jgi:choline dehydrogenase-like flavoprotein
MKNASGDTTYDLIVCGTGFAGSFFVKKYLQRRPKAKILVLEQGDAKPYLDQLAERKLSDLNYKTLYRKTGLASKDWIFTVALGGGSNCWNGQVPRFMPEDFELKTRYGIGVDWPFGYDEVEPYYCEAEKIMMAAGPKIVPWTMSSPYPLPPHPTNAFDRKMIELVGPQNWIASPNARASQAIPSRGKCCASGVCKQCPVDAKFRVMNGLAELYQNNPQVSLRLHTEVKAVDVEGGVAKGVIWEDGGKQVRARGDLVVLALGSIFNPTILRNSGDSHPQLAKRLADQAGFIMTADLASLKNFDGGTAVTGLGYMYYGGEARKRRASCLIDQTNAPPFLRFENGKWRCRVILNFAFENLPEERNQVIPGEPPTLHFADHSDYAKVGMAEVKADFEKLLSHVDIVEKVEYVDAWTEWHILSTAVMGHDPATSVVDGDFRHHKIRNLLVAGGSAFPTISAAAPSLTIAALSLRAADRLTA